MAVIHTNTTLTPNKLELLTSWLPSRPWYLATGQEPSLARAGGFRLDDPKGEVGIEFIAVADTSGGEPTVYQVPLTYRAAPLEGAEHALLGTMEHGVLGRRWTYDGAHDPVLRAELFALLNGVAEAQAQSVSNTPDPTVLARFAHADPATSARLLQVTDGPDGTDLLLRTDATTAQPLAIRVQRRLIPGQQGPLGEVTAGWTLPDGTALRGSYAVVHPADESLPAAVR